MFKLQFLDKHLVPLLTVVILVGILFATSGCGIVDGALQDIAGTATALREISKPLEERARAKDAERNAKWLTIWTMQQEDYAEIGHEPKKLPKFLEFGKFGKK